MPLPFLAAGLALGAAAVGIGAQLSAKETNEQAQQIVDEAKQLYDNAKSSLDKAQEKTEKSLLALGNAKKDVLETSVNQFLTAYERIKNIELSESVGLDEIKNFALEKQDALQLREMADIYQSTFSSGAAGAATGAVIALAASGSLPVVTGVLSTAGTALMAGEIGMAAGLAGSALSFGAAMTPLAAIAAPALLFSGISSSIKADENLEKAQTMYAEAEAASEQMKTSEVLCGAIADRADMFGGLLDELNAMFSPCTLLLDKITRKKMGLFKNKTVDAKTFTDDELKLVAVTRALAGAVKSVIDTPILTVDGAVSPTSQVIYDDTSNRLPAFAEAVNDVKSCDYNVKSKGEVLRIKEDSTLSSQKTTPKLAMVTPVARFLIIVAIFAVLGILLLGVIFGATNPKNGVSAPESTPQNEISTDVETDTVPLDKEAEHKELEESKTHDLPNENTEQNPTTVPESTDDNLEEETYDLPPISTQEIAEAVGNIFPDYVGVYDGLSGTITADEVDPSTALISDCTFISTYPSAFDFSDFSVDLEMHCNRENQYAWECVNIITNGSVRLNNAGEYTISRYANDRNISVSISPNLSFDDVGNVVLESVYIVDEDPMYYSSSLTEDGTAIIETSMYLVFYNQQDSELFRKMDIQFYATNKDTSPYFIYFDKNMIPVLFTYDV